MFSRCSSLSAIKELNPALAEDALKAVERVKTFRLGELYGAADISFKQKRGPRQAAPFMLLQPRRQHLFVGERYCPLLDFKNRQLLSEFLGPTGKILGSSLTGLSPRRQSEAARAVVRARQMCVIPYLSHVTYTNEALPTK